jgi:hypothetical protein
MSGKSVVVGDGSTPVRRTSSQHLKAVTFTMNGRKYTAIEQKS